MSRGVLILVTLTLFVLASMSADFYVVHSINERVAKFRSSGADILVVAAPGGIDSALCESLAHAPDVIAAGASRQIDMIYPATTPRSGTMAYEVSPGFPSVLAVTTAGSGAFISRDVAHTLGVGVGGDYVTMAGKTSVAGVFEYPQDGRRPGYGYATLFPVRGTKLFDQCWMRVWPVRQQMRQRILLALIDNSSVRSKSAEVSQLNTTLGESIDPSAEFQQRATRILPLGLLLLCSLAVGWVWNLRRLELAQSLHSGVTRQDLLLIAILEITLIVVPVALLVMTASAVASQAFFPAGDASGMLMLSLEHLLGGGLGAMLGVLFVVARTSQKNLLRAFRER